MIQILQDHPWLIVCMLAAGVIVICTAIIFITEHFRTSQQAEIDASLKHEMLSRGMSAADIKTVLEASADGRNNDQPVRVGLGKFQVEVGGAVRPAEAGPARPAEARG
jgi:hypothetical protein